MFSVTYFLFQKSVLYSVYSFLAGCMKKVSFKLIMNKNSEASKDEIYYEIKMFM